MIAQTIQRDRINHSRTPRIILRREYSLTSYDSSIFNLEENYGDNTIIEIHRTPPSAKRQASTVPSRELAQAIMEPQLPIGNNHNDL